MRKITRDTWIAISLLVILVIIAASLAIRQIDESNIPYASFSNAPNGTRALKLWLEKLGYETVDIVSPTFEPPEDATIMLILEPSFIIIEHEWDIIDDWITDGGTLILAGNGWGIRSYFQHFDCKLAFMNSAASKTAPQVPVLLAPPQEEPVIIDSLNYLQVDRTDYTTLLAADGQAIAITFKQGDGRVILSAAPSPFSNAGLKQDSNPEFVLNLIGLSSPPTVVWFDEWHHGIRASGEEIRGPGNWLRKTSAGQALLFATGAIFVALVLRGRNFGRPISPEKADTRRTPLEHVTSIANLNRRAKHRQSVLAQYHHELKRSLGKRYHINPTLPDASFLEALSRINTEINLQELETLLRKLRNPNTSEAEMLALATQAIEWLDEYASR